MRIVASGVTLLSAGAGALIAASHAGACSCAGPGPGVDGERQALAAGTRAFIGTVVSKRNAQRDPAEDVGPRVFVYRVRVRRSFNVRLPRVLHLTSREDESSCGFEWRRGERVAGYLYGRRGKWKTDLCSMADARDLVRDARPYPPPTGRGRVALLAYGAFSGASTIALDRRGRILGYGFGLRPVGYGPFPASICPGSRVAVEAGSERPRRPTIVTRDLSTLRAATRRRADAFAVRCLSADGGDVALASGGIHSADGPAAFRLLRMRGARRQVLRRGEASALELSPRFAFSLEGRASRRLVATDLGNGRSRRIARLPAGGEELSVSPDGTRLALIVPGFLDPPRRAARLVMVDLNGARPRIRVRRLSAPAAGGALVWDGNERLLRLPTSHRPRRVRAYDARLRPLGAFGRWRGGLGVPVGQRLLEINGDVLRSVSTRRRSGRRLRALPTASATTLLAVPGQPRLAASPRRPSPKRPKVRRACRPRERARSQSPDQ